MPGVPSGRGCDACRKQKKKCDQLTPSCSRCARLSLCCTGAGQKRYKFMGQYDSQLTRNTSAKQAKSSNDKRPITALTADVLRTPSNELTLLLSAYLSAVKPSTDLRFNLAWSYGDYLAEIPLRLGINEALDAATSALLDAHSNHCRGLKVTVESLARYSHALKTLRYCLDDPIKAKAAETLCSVNLLLICQGFLGISQGAWSGHVEGLTHMVIARGNAEPQSRFEQTILRSMRGSIIFEGLANKRIKLPVKEWKRLAHNPLDGESYEGKLTRSLCMVPYFIEYRNSRDASPHEEAKILAEIIAGYNMLKPAIEDLRKLFAEASQKVEPDYSYRRAAYITRTYGFCLAVAIIINCVLGAIYTDDQEYPLEAEEFAKEILTISDSDVTKNQRPLGSNYIPLCLSMAWIGSRDPLLKCAFEDALEEYQSHPSWGQMVKITVPDLIWTEKRFKLMNPDTPYLDAITSCVA